MSKGLFHRAIAQSGVSSEPWSIDSTAHAKLYTENFAKAAKCPTTDPTQLLACLRSKTSTELLEAYLPQLRKHQLTKPHIIGQWFEPTIEAVHDSETFLSQHPLAIVEEGKAQQIPLILGQVSSEGLLTASHFYNDPSKISRYESNFNELTTKLFEISENTPGKDEIGRKIREFYFPPNVTTTEDKLDQFTKMFSDSVFNLHIHQVASVQRKYSPMYLYNFNRRGGPSLTPFLIFFKEDISVAAQGIFYLAKEFINRVIFRSLPPNYGVAHFDDMAFLFNVPNMFYIPKDDSEMYKFSKDFTKLWVSFAKNEDLAFRGLPFSQLDKTGPLKYFELNETPQIVEEVFGDRIAFLKSLGFLKYSY
ncbi:unnamed protein product [Allacma fusca]|uniref:Carboxylesterase type B domain-containing protein n=1 Tax=Allacma fusca TaxID=39272 RepID=A0A8J2KMQ9_9HEXA|nr:unnamed protein product [Allacma fusca]